MWILLAAFFLPKFVRQAAYDMKEFVAVKTVNPERVRSVLGMFMDSTCSCHVPSAEKQLFKCAALPETNTWSIVIALHGDWSTGATHATGSGMLSKRKSGTLLNAWNPIL